MTGALPTADELGLSYDGDCPEFGSHGFTGRDGKSGLYTCRSGELGAPVFAWQGRPMYFVSEPLHGLRPYDTPWEELQGRRAA